MALTLVQAEPMWKDLRAKVKCLNPECGWRGDVGELIIYLQDDEELHCPKCEKPRWDYA
jgi:hypothetical protein